jgi:hypothetical protein
MTLLVIAVVAIYLAGGYLLYRHRPNVEPTSD